MEILLALGVAAAMAQKPADLVEHGRAFAGSILSPAARPKYASPSARYTASREPSDPRDLPIVENSLTAIRTTLRGCKVGKVNYYKADPDDPASHPGIFVWFDCPDDFAHAYGDLFLDLAFTGGIVTRAHLQVGVPTVTPPS